MALFHDVRLSLIWAETNTGLLDKKATNTLPLSKLGQRSDFEALFNDVKGSVSNTGLKLPWLRPQQQRFWKHYFEDQRLENVTGSNAWKKLVPLRKDICSSITRPGQGGRCFLEGWCYPFGFSCTLTIVLDGKYNLEELVDAMHEAYRNREYEIVWDSHSRPTRLNPMEIRNKGLEYLRAKALEPQNDRGFLPDSPFSIVTMIKGSIVNQTDRITESDEVHRALEAMTTWDRNWKNNNLPNLANMSTRGAAPSSHLMYGGRRGRVLWSPTLFASTDPRIRSLGCLHRNLLFLSLQVESLSGLVKEAAKEIRSREPRFGASFNDCAKRAGGILGRLYGGASTYRSWSPYYQLVQNNMLADLNTVRQHYGQELITIPSPNSPDTG